jgi:hypothetical protein
VTGVFGPSILSYYYSDALVAMGRLPVAILTYGMCYEERWEAQEMMEDASMSKKRREYRDN